MAFTQRSSLSNNPKILNPVSPGGEGEGGATPQGISAPIVFNQGKKHRFQTAISRVAEIPKLGHMLGDLNPFFEQVPPSRSSGESLGADMPLANDHPEEPASCK